MTVEEIDPLNRVINKIEGYLDSVEKDLKVSPVFTANVWEEVSAYNKLLDTGLPRLKKLKPDCRDDPERYERRCEAYQMIVGEYLTTVDELRTKLQKLANSAQQSSECYKAFENRLEEHKSVLEYLSELAEGKVRQRLVALQQKYEVVQKSISEGVDSSKRQIDEVRNQSERAQMFETTLGELKKETHEWVQKKIEAPYPTAKPGEVRTVIKTRDECRKCGKIKESA